MRSRTPIPRAKPSTNPVYETFQPMSELKENEQAYFLHIYLPGAYTLPLLLVFFIFFNFYFKFIFLISNKVH